MKEIINGQKILTPEEFSTTVLQICGFSIRAGRAKSVYAASVYKASAVILTRKIETHYKLLYKSHACDQTKGE